MSREADATPDPAARTVTALKRVDPRIDVSRPGRLYTSVLRTGVGRWLSINVASRVDPWLLRTSKGRVGMALMLPNALLTTQGARSGRRRQNPVLYFHDGDGDDDDVIIVASSFGRERHPAWYHNLRAHPVVSIGEDGQGQRMRATTVSDPREAARLWELADRVYPPYADYRERASATGREIPLVRLTPTE